MSIIIIILIWHQRNKTIFPENSRNREIKCDHYSLLYDSLVAQHLWSDMYATEFRKKSVDSTLIRDQWA